MMQALYVLVWWVALEVIGLVCFPLVSRICGNLRDKGYSISKLVGLVILTFIVWMISSLRILPFGYVSILISFLLLAAFCLYFGRKNLKPSGWPRGPIIVSEAVFAVSFIGFVLVMVGKPDIYFGGADFFMDYAFMGSILRGGYFPPLDPWFAGEGLSYYYGGHLIAAMLTVATRVPPPIAFNIAVAMFFALTVVASYGLGYNLTRRNLYAALTAVLVCGTGFLTGAYQLIGHLLNTDIMGVSHIAAPSIIEWMLRFDFWSAPWLIPYAMAQYPYYIFLAGTLHAFMMSIPFQVMFIMLLFGLLQKSRFGEKPTTPDTLLDVSVMSLSLGFFSIVNTWEYPVYAALTVAVFAFLRIRRGIRTTVAMVGGIIVLSFLLYLPYYLSRGMGGVGWFGLVTGRTDLASFFEACALFLFLLFSWLLVLRRAKLFRGWAPLVGALLVVMILVAVFAGIPLLIILAPLILLPLYHIVRSGTKAETEFVLLLVVMGAALALFCEIIYIDDPYGPPWERFNTVFKMYVPLWIALGVASAYAAYYVLGRLRRVTKSVWLAVAALLLLACLVHPVASTVSATGGRHSDWGINRGTLDGMAYLETIEKGDYEAIQWLNRQVKGHPVTLEAPGAVFRYSSRVSTFTGLPTIIGWTSWEVMWRGDWGAVQERESDSDTIYSTVDNEEALALLGKYHVEYVYVGGVERERYAAEGLQKFANWPEFYVVVYEGEGVTIYEVKGE